MKKLLFLFLFLALWPHEAKSQPIQVTSGYFVQNDCDSINNRRDNVVICIQLETSSNRVPGEYKWNGTAWIKSDGVYVQANAPTQCVVGEVWFKTNAVAGQNLYAATAVNPCVWTVQGAAPTTTGHVFHEEGGAPLTQRADVNCVGNGITCADVGGQTEINVPGGGAPTFQDITPGTNTAGAMVVGTGSSLGVSGTGTINPDYTPSGTIAATTLKGAVAELDSETQTALAGKQPNDADLTAVSALACIGGAYRTAANTWNCRTIVPISGEITVLNGDGVAGNPAIGLGVDAVKRNQANTYSGGGGLQDFTLSTMKIPNAAGYAPTAHGLPGINNTTNEVSIGVNGTNKKFIFQGDPVLGVATALAADPAGCTLANGEWTNDINASGVSNCVKVIQSAAATPSAGTSRYPGDIYADTRAFACATGAGRMYRASTVGGNFSAVAGESDNVTTFQGQSGAWTVCGAGTLSIVGSGGFTTAATGTFGNPGTITINPPTPTDDMVMVGSGTTWVGKLLPNCATALTYDTATNAFGCGGGGGGGTPPGGSGDDIQFNDGAGAFAGGRCTMDTNSNISCAGGITTGTAAVASGSWTPSGVTSGSATIGVADAAGTPARINLPTTTGAASSILTSDGATPQQTRWETVANLFSSTVFTLGNLPVAAKYRPCEIVIGDPGAASPLLADDNDSPSNCKNVYGTTLTITSVNCYAPAGSPTITPIITGSGATSILTGALTCTNAAGGAAGTLNGTPSQSANGTLDINITTAGGVAKYLVVYINRSL